VGQFSARTQLGLGFRHNRGAGGTRDTERMFRPGKVFSHLFDAAPQRDDHPSLNAHDVDGQLRRAQFKSMNDVLPMVMFMAAVSSVLLYVVLSQSLPAPTLSVWLASRLGINFARGTFSYLCNKGVLQPSQRNFHAYAVLALLDGLAWGAMGWWLTPLDRLDVAIITLTMTVIVACIGVLGLHVHMPSALAFVLPVTLPTAIHALGRHDQLGLLCFAAMVGLTLMLAFEMKRFNVRFLEILRLRFESEQTALAKTEALRQADALAQTRSRFVATMSHEIRTPLHGMLGLLALVNKAEQISDARRHLALMQSTGDHLVKVINEVLEHARMDASGLPVHAQPFKLNELLHELADMVRTSCEDKGLHFGLEADIEADLYVAGDATRIRQVLHNLLSNALKFTSEGGITFKAWRNLETGHVHLTVRDSGVGIPADELERIFEPYHQAEGTYERRFGGTGLGLTISRELCEAMGGTLTCTSQAGKGSEFICELPLPVVPAVSTRLAAAADDGLMGLHAQVLLVEDNPVNTIVAEAALKRLGLHVTAVDSGEAALAWLGKHRADVVFMDCEMPGLDGIQTTRQIRALERAAGKDGVPIIAMTANGQDTYEERCVPAGMNDYLGKPFGPEALKAVVMRQLGRTFKQENAMVE
jgi:signal transduction histidine kinase/AmiR/NasT family two-component response regulator